MRQAVLIQLIAGNVTPATVGARAFDLS